MRLKQEIEEKLKEKKCSAIQAHRGRQIEEEKIKLLREIRDCFGKHDTEIADNEDLINFLTFIAERLRLKDDGYMNVLTKYGVVNYIITKIKNNDIR